MLQVAIKRDTNEKFAVKIINKQKFGSKEDEESFHNEVTLMQRVKGHPHVVELHEYFEDKCVPMRC